MEIRGIQVYGAGSSFVNGDYLIKDMLSSGYKREWHYTTDSRTMAILVISITDETGVESGEQWAICDITDENNTVVYYILDPTNNEPCKEPLKYVDEEGNTIINGVWRVDIGNPELLSNRLEPNDTPKLKWISDPDITTESKETESEYDESTKQSIITKTKIHTNRRTGDIAKETDVVKETVNQYESKIVEWQATPSVAIGKVYRFSFIREFKELGYIRGFDTDPRKGIYKVTDICHLHSLIKTGVDLYENLYAPLGLSKELYKFDLENINASILYKLTDLENPAKFVYMPMCYFDGNPDASIEEFNRIMLAIDLGYFADVSLVAELLEIVKHLLLCKFGMDETENVDPCQIAVSESSFMHMDEYTLLDLRREQLKGSDKAKAAANILLTKLFESKMNNLRERNIMLSAQLSAYEDAVTGNKE